MVVDRNKQLKLLSNLIEVEVKENDFLKIVETLTRVGVSSAIKNELYQSCNILHKAGRYWILHFKHLMMLDGLTVTISEQDIERYETICLLLEQWGLTRIIEKSKIKCAINLKIIKIVPFKDKQNWTLIPKFTIGK